MDLKFYFLLTLVAAYGIARTIIPVIIHLTLRHQLLDVPDERKQHQQPTPAFGGIGIFAGFIITTLFWLDSTAIEEGKFLFPAIMILFITGMKDDIQAMNPGKKFAMQFLAAIIVVAGGFRITDMYGLFGFHHLHAVFQYLFSVLFIAGFTNAFNLIDGVDGLAGGIGTIISSTLSIIFISSGLYFYAALCIALCGSLLGFLKYNFSPAKIFMGDTGSLVLGFLISVLSIKMLSIQNMKLVHLEISNPMIMMSALLFIPLFDTFRVFIIRLSKGKSPFHADRKHLHHILQKNNLSHRMVCLVVYSVTILFISGGLWMQHLNTNKAVLLIFISAVLLVDILTVAMLLRNKKKIKAMIGRFYEHEKQNRFIRHLFKEQKIS